jgi:peptide deformylase
MSYITSLYPDPAPSVLITRAAEIQFPLSLEDKRDLEILEQKFDAEENCAGLAAPQIGISKQIIIFEAPDDPVLKKWRPDLTQTMPRTIWINPTYEGIDEAGFHVDYEACFSVGGVAAPVKRFKKIRYGAYDPHGTLIEGMAEGFLARMIQHETDHVYGILYVDRVEDKNLILPVEEYRRRRQAAMEG